MPTEVNPGVTTCSSCHRVVLVEHVNSSGRCSECAGKTESQLREHASEPSGNRMAGGGSVLVESDPAGTEGEPAAEPGDGE